MSDFAKEAKKRDIQIKILNDAIAKVNEHLTEQKSSEFYAQKGKQFETTWQSILDTTNVMLGDEYEQAHHDQLITAQEVYDDILIKIRERNSVKQSSMIKLPQVNLPHFDGAYYNWLSFRDSYEQMFHFKKDLVDVEKLQYLKTCVSGEAAQLIKHLQTTTDFRVTKSIP